MNDEHRMQRLEKLRSWIKFYWTMFFILLLVVMFLVKGAPFAQPVLIAYILGGLVRFLYKYEGKRRELGFKQ